MSTVVERQAAVALHGSTSLRPTDVLGALDPSSEDRAVAVQVRIALLRAGAALHRVDRGDDRMEVALRAWPTARASCRFSVAAVSSVDGRTQVRIGGLTGFSTVRQRVWRVLPVGPAEIEGFHVYEMVLRAMHAALRSLDPTADLELRRAGS